MMQGNDFKIYTDHSAICKALEKNTPRENSRETKMLSYIASWRKPVLHISGKDNEIADLMSRQFLISSILMGPKAITKQELKDAQKDSPEIEKILQNKSSGLTLELVDEIYCNKFKGITRPYIPKQLQRKVFDAIHEMAHTGPNRTQKLIQARFVWSGMKKMVKNWAQACMHCQSCKITRHNKPQIEPISVSSEKFRDIACDIVGPLTDSNGFRYILTIVDRYSGWLEAVPIVEATINSALRALIQNWICRYGIPNSLITDRGSIFTSPRFRDVMRSFGIRHNLTCAWNPASNGCVERTHRVLKSALRGGESTNWSHKLPFALLAINSSYQQGTKTCPSAIVFGTPLQLPGQIVENEIDPENKPAKHAEEICKLMTSKNFRENRFPPKRGHEDPRLKTCEYVFIKNAMKKHSLAPLYLGPFKVLQRFDKYFRVQLDKSVDNIALHRLKPVVIAKEDYNGELEEDENEQLEIETDDLSSEKDRENINQRQIPMAQQFNNEEIDETNEEGQVQNPQQQDRDNLEQTHGGNQMENQDVRLDPVNLEPGREPGPSRVARTSRKHIDTRPKNSKRLTFTPSPERIRQSFTETRVGRKSKPPKRYGF